MAGMTDNGKTGMTFEGLNDKLDAIERRGIGEDR